jgi:hypothetical protein
LGKNKDFESGSTGVVSKVGQKNWPEGSWTLQREGLSKEKFTLTRSSLRNFSDFLFPRTGFSTFSEANLLENVLYVNQNNEKIYACFIDWAIPIIICTPPVEEPLSHVGTPLEFPQIFM